MNIALIGYGRMGKEIEQIALDRGHHITQIIDVNNADQFNSAMLKDVDVAIEFSLPASAVKNYEICFEAGVPVVSGTTGWLDQWDRVIEKCQKSNSAFFYASNFSLGVNLFFKLNAQLAKLMKSFDQYTPEMTEIHHTQKLDAPSGTAISLGEDIIDSYKMEGWINEKSDDIKQLGIVSLREPNVPGTHTIKYDSEIDYVEITHCAKSRKGFALGAVLAAEFSKGKTGILSMDDLLNLEK